MAQTNDELLKQLAETLGGNTEIMKRVLEKMSALEEKVAEQSQQLENVTSQLHTVTEKQEMFTAHLNQIYNSQSIEETLAIMGEMGKDDMDIAECSVYSYDTLENKLFTVDENGARVYTEISEDTPVGAALLKNEMFFQNQYEGNQLGDGAEDKQAKNVAVIPIEAKTGDVIGVVVAKDSSKVFSAEDAKRFDLKEGKIGSAFRIGLENKALNQAAVTDKLTHLHNRHGMEQFLKSSVLPKLQQGEKLSTIMIDIDHFKGFNDTYGHDVGDKVLQQVAGILKDNVRADDGVFRWGGEEMVVIANMNTADAYSLAERLRKSIESTPLDVGNGEKVRITASMGVAGISNETVQDLNKDNIVQFFVDRPMKHADERMYQAKESGRNRVVAPDKIMKKYADRGKVSIQEEIKDIRAKQAQEQKNAPQPDKSQKKTTGIE